MPKGVPHDGALHDRRVVALLQNQGLLHVLGTGTLSGASSYESHLEPRQIHMQSTQAEKGRTVLGGSCGTRGGTLMQNYFHRLFVCLLMFCSLQRLLKPLSGGFLDGRITSKRGGMRF